MQKEESKRVLRRSPRVGKTAAHPQLQGANSTSSLDVDSQEAGIGNKSLAPNPTSPTSAKKNADLGTAMMTELFEGHKKKRVEYSFMMGEEATGTGCIALEETDTIGQLKLRIQENQGILVERQLISMGAVQLEDKDVPMGSKSKLFMTDYTSLAAERPCKISSAEKRGITVEQLGKLREFIKSHRAKDRTLCGWCDMDLHSETYGQPLRYSTFDAYQLIEWIVNPFTKRSSVSYVEMIAQEANAQEPHWFLACHFAEPIIGLTSCVDAHAKVRAFPETTSYWICVFSCSQQELDHTRRDHLHNYMTEQPFYRALKHCRGLLFVADSSERAFSRIWCCFELSLHLCFKSKRRLLDIATDYRNKSYVLTDGLTEAEQKKSITSEPIAGWTKKTKREIDFPMWALTQALDMDVGAGDSTDPQDKDAILDFLKNEWDGGLSIEQLNMKIRAAFAQVCWRGAVATDLKDMQIREKLVKTIKCEQGRKSVASFMCGFPAFSHDHMCELVDTLPRGLEKMTLDCTGCKQLSDNSLSTLMRGLPTSVTALDVSFCGIENITDAGLSEVSENLPKNLSKFRFFARNCWKISSDGVSNLILAIQASSIKDLELSFRGCTKIRDDCAQKLLFGLPATITSLHLDFGNTGVSNEMIGCMASMEDVRLYKHRVLEAEKEAQDAANAATVAAKKAKQEAKLAQDLKTLEGLMEKFSRDPQGMTLQEKKTLAELLRMQKELQKEEYRKAIRRSPRAGRKGAASTPGAKSEGSGSDGDKCFDRRKAVHGELMKHPLVSPQSTMSFWKTPSPKETDDDIQLYFRWAAGRVQTVHDLFRSYDASGRYTKFRNVTAREFVEYILWHGYEGNALHVFETIQLENTGLSKEVAVAGGGEFGEISLSQLQRFERRHTQLSRGAESPVVRFVKKLRRSRGCLLRAWRMDMDLRGAGLVAQADFIRACRRLGFSSEVTELWNSFRPGQGTAPLEFREFDGPEAMNLDRFAEALWSAVDFDLNKAWCCLDPHNRGVSTLKEFTDGARLLGFDGNAQLLFKGLDSSGLGKLKRHELLYLQVLTQSVAKTDYVAPPIRALGKWVYSVLGSPNTLIVRLGLGENGNVSLSADDLTTQLIRLGYRGDAKRASALISQFGRNDRINSDMLYSLLADTVGHTSSPTVKTSRTCKSSPPIVAVSKTPIPKKEWQGTVTDVSQYNLQSAPGARAYFSTPAGGCNTLLHPRNIQHRPGRTLNDLGYTYYSHHEDERSSSTVLDQQEMDHRRHPEITIDGEGEEQYSEEGQEDEEATVEGDQSSDFLPLTLTEEAIRRHENIPEFRAPPRLIVNTTDATRTLLSPHDGTQRSTPHHTRGFVLRDSVV